MEVVPITTIKEKQTQTLGSSPLAITDHKTMDMEMATIKHQLTTMGKNIVSHLVVMLTKLPIYQVVILFKKTSIQNMNKPKIDHKKKLMNIWKNIRSNVLVRMFQDLCKSLLSHLSQSSSSKSCKAQRISRLLQLFKVKLGQLLSREETSSVLLRQEVERHYLSFYQESCMLWHKQ